MAPWTLSEASAAAKGAPLDTKAFFYDAEGRDREIALGDASVDTLAPDQLLWIDMPDREEDHLRQVSALLKLPPELLAACQMDRPQLDNYGEYFRFHVDTAPAPQNHQKESDREKPAKADPAQGIPGSVRVDFIVSERWLVTIHDGEATCLERFRDQDKKDTQIGQLSGQALAASLLDWHLGDYFAEVARIEEAVDKLDERLLREATSHLLLGRIVALRRRVSKLRSLLGSQRDVFYGLSRPDFALITDSGAAPFYEALAVRFERAIDEVERSRDLVVGSFELFTSRTGQQTNDLVKLLTFLTAIVGFCAAIAGLMGMNFKLAFFETGMFGFTLVTGGLLLLALISVAYARYREWI